MARILRGFIALLVASMVLAIPLLVVAPDWGASALPEFHDPITILSDYEFTSAKGVRSGTGSETNPYVIENWMINPGTADGIRVQSTLAHFEIRNVVISGAGASGYHGVNLVSVSHCRIESCTVEWEDFGVRGVTCKDVVVTHCQISDCRAGIRFDTSQGLAIKGNTITACQFGVGFQSDQTCTVSANSIATSSQAGVYIDSSSGIQVKANLIENGNAGVFLTESSYVTVHRNAILNNTIQGYEDSGTGDIWYDQSAGRGNNWSDYAGSDLNGNGIGDTQYTVSSGQKDQYPLMAAYSDSPPVAQVNATGLFGNTRASMQVDASPSYDGLDGHQWLEYRWDWDSDGAWDTAWTNLAATQHRFSSTGSITVTVQVQDTCCNLGTATAVVTIEDTSPSISINEQDGMTVKGGELAVSWESNDAGSGLDRFVIVVDGWNATTLNTTDTSYTITELTEGNHTVTVFAFDRAGNNASDELRFTVLRDDASGSWMLVAAFGIGAFAAVALATVVMRRRRKGSA